MKNLHSFAVLVAVAFSLTLAAGLLWPQSQPCFGTCQGHALQNQPVSEQTLAQQEVRRLARVVHTHYHVAENRAVQIVEQAKAQALRHHLPVSLVLAVIARESSFQPQTIRQKDYGLMQVNAFWHAGQVAKEGGARALLHISTNIRVGTRILAEYVRQTGSTWKALRFYNGRNKTNHYPDEVLRLQRQFEA